MDPHWLALVNRERARTHKHTCIPHTHTHHTHAHPPASTHGMTQVWDRAARRAVFAAELAARQQWEQTVAPFAMPRSPCSTGRFGQTSNLATLNCPRAAQGRFGQTSNLATLNLPRATQGRFGQTSNLMLHWGRYGQKSNLSTFKQLTH